MLFSFFVDVSLNFWFHYIAMDVQFKTWNYTVLFVIKHMFLVNRESKIDFFRKCMHDFLCLKSIEPFWKCISINPMLIYFHLVIHLYVIYIFHSLFYFHESWKSLNVAYSFSRLRKSKFSATISSILIFSRFFH